MATANRKNILVPLTFFVDVYALISQLEGFELDPDTKALCKSIETQIETKIDALSKHRAFSEYKTAVGEDREKKRREYLDMAGIHQDWRTDRETCLGDI